MGLLLAFHFRFVSLRSKLVAPHKLRRTLRSHILFSGEEGTGVVRRYEERRSFGLRSGDPNPGRNTGARVQYCSLRPGSYPRTDRGSIRFGWNWVGIVALRLLSPSSCLYAHLSLLPPCSHLFGSLTYLLGSQMVLPHERHPPRHRRLHQHGPA
jgi:hypothetical protein